MRFARVREPHDFWALLAVAMARSISAGVETGTRGVMSSPVAGLVFWMNPSLIWTP